MKKAQTIFLKISFIAIVMVMAQGCIPTTPVGGNPTPNPDSRISYKVFNQSLEDSIPDDESILIAFDDIKPITLEKIRFGLVYLTNINFNMVHDTTTEILVKRGTYSDLTTTHYTTNYTLASNTKINASSVEWNNGLSHNIGDIIVESGIGVGTLNHGINDLYSKSNISSYWSIPQQTQNFYIAFRAPLISDPSKYAFGWLQLKSVVANEGNGNYLKSLQLMDGAIETNVGEIYTGNH